MVRDAFLLPQIDEALQAVHSSSWFSSFDLIPGVPAVGHGGAFRAGTSGLYKFTHMPFGLSNADFSFCQAVEQCLGYKQFVTLLLYLDDICNFAPSIEVMLDSFELVFNRLKEFHLKIKPNKCHFFDASVLFLGHVLCARRISANPQKVEKVKDRQTPTNAKEIHSFLGLSSYYQRFIPKFAQMAHCLHEFIGPTFKKNQEN